MVGGAYLVLAQNWRWDLIFYSLPVGLMVANILFFQNLPDMKTDQAVGKYTLAVRLGKRWSRIVFRLWWILVYISLIALFISGLTNALVWGCLLTLPLLIKVDRLIGEADDWITLDRHGHLVRKMYLINGVLLILSCAPLW